MPYGGLPNIGVVLKRHVAIDHHAKDDQGTDRVAGQVGRFTDDAYQPGTQPAARHQQVGTKKK